MSTCERCGAAFACAVAEGLDTPCWCMALPAVVPLPRADGGAKLPACLCPGCLREQIARASTAVTTARGDGEDAADPITPAWS